MVSQHSVEQTIYGTKARLRPATIVGQLRVSYHNENIPSYDVKDSDIRRAVTTLQPCQLCIPLGTRNPSGPNGPTTNWIAGAKS